MTAPQGRSSRHHDEEGEQSVASQSSWQQVAIHFVPVRTVPKKSVKKLLCEDGREEEQSIQGSMRLCSVTEMNSKCKCVCVCVL